MLEKLLSFYDRLNNFPYLSLLLILLCILLFVCLIIQSITFSRKLKKERSDAINRSRAVLNGQMVEQIAPFLPNFPCNPGDARFIGKPVDYIAFPGLADKDSVDEVLLIEVKTGTSKLNEREKGVKNAVKQGRVRYVEYRLN